MFFRRLLTIGLAVFPALAMGCGLDWTLPHVHFDGVEEHGYVSYWEKIGEADLGDELVIPVHISFDSHREASSPTLGKGWMMPLLESHVEPVDENCVKVIMPDGWTFTFYRNDNTESWRGNAGWAGETKETLFTITAPCGWRIKFDEGKIREIDSGKNRSLTYRYDGGVATEVDENGKTVVEVVRDGNGAAGIVIGDKRIEVTQADRPRVARRSNQNLITGLDASLSQLQWPDGKKEKFAFGTDKELSPTLDIVETGQPERQFTWDAETRMIKSDGTWSYLIKPMGDHLRFELTSASGQLKSDEEDAGKGMTLEKAVDGPEIATYRFASGPLAGRVRKVAVQTGRTQTVLYAASYYPSGQLMREMISPDRMRIYSEKGKLLKETEGKDVLYEQDFDELGRLAHLIDPGKQLEVKRTFDAQGAETTEVYRQGALFYTLHADKDNKLVSLDEGKK